MRRLLLILVACAPPSCAQSVLVNPANGPNGSVTNSPVSLVIERKQGQTLADGTHISTTTHEYFYRDSLGRTRTENEFSAFPRRPEPMRSINVQDPVAGVMLNWMAGQPGQAGGPREYNRMTTTAAQQFTPQPRTAGAVALSTPARQIPITPASSSAQRPDFKYEDLGLRDVQGASCHAMRTTITYPIDFLGNDRPITTTQEQCTSQEFGRFLQETYEDPRTGTRTTTVQSLSRGEPDPSLFQPPAGYTEHVKLSQQGR